MSRCKTPSSDPPRRQIVDAVKWWQEYRPGGGNLSSEHPQPKRSHIRLGRRSILSHI